MLRPLLAGDFNAAGGAARCLRIGKRPLRRVLFGKTAFFKKI